MADRSKFDLFFNNKRVGSFSIGNGTVNCVSMGKRPTVDVVTTFIFSSNYPNEEAKEKVYFFFSDESKGKKAIVPEKEYSDDPKLKINCYATRLSLKKKVFHFRNDMWRGGDYPDFDNFRNNVYELSDHEIEIRLNSKGK